MQLSKICNRLYELIEQVDLETGELSPEFLELESQLTDKADEIGEIILYKESEIDNLKTIGQSYLARATAQENKLKTFKGWLAQVVSKFGAEEKSGKKWLRGKLVGIKDNSVWKLKVLDEDKIPVAFKNASVSIKCTVNDASKIVKKLLPMKEIEVDTKQSINTKALSEHILEQGFEIDGIQKYYENRVLLTGYKKNADS